jgi:hypothetical protein
MTERETRGHGFLNTLNRTFLWQNVAEADYNREVSPMEKKKAIVKETAAATSPARAAKPKTPRVKTARHSKVVSTEPAVAYMSHENPQEAIAEIAYTLWESRGCPVGTALEDWVSAEHEYRQRLAATRL